MEEIKQLLVPIEGENGVTVFFKIGYDGTNDGSISILSPFAPNFKNEGLDIEKEIYLQEVIPQEGSEYEFISIPIRIMQEGKREVFKCQDLKHGPSLSFTPADGGTFNVLK